MLGTDFPYDEFLAAGRPIIQVDRKVDHIGRRAPVSLGLVGDVGATLEVLGPQVKGDHDVWKQWRDEFRANVIL